VRAPLLAVDSGSPVASVALVGGAGEVLALRTLDRLQTSQALLPTIEAAMADAGITLARLGGVVGVRGPGSFTGLRVGLATLLGFHQALALPATGVTTLAGPAAPPEAAAIAVAGGDGRVVALVDALRGEWFAQTFAGGGTAAPRPLDDPRRVDRAGLAELAGGLVCGFGVETAARAPGWPEHLRPRDAGPLAPWAARLAAAPGAQWEPLLLTQPLYLAAPVGDGRPRG
jgi:tRNA threonylcarbamoyl adenosine modification protein YeaZ